MEQATKLKALPGRPPCAGTLSGEFQRETGQVVKLSRWGCPRMPLSAGDKHVRVSLTGGEKQSSKFQVGGASQAPQGRSCKHGLPERLGICLSSKWRHVLLPSAICKFVMSASVKAGREAV